MNSISIYKIKLSCTRIPLSISNASQPIIAVKKLTILLVAATIVVIVAASVIYLHFETSRITSSTTITFSTANSYGVSITDSMAIPSVADRFDHMSIDVQDQLVFIAAHGNNSVYVANLITEGVVHIINGLDEPQGVYYDELNHELYVSNGGNGALDVFSVPSYHLIKVLNFSSDADNIRFDPSTNLLYVGYGEENQSGIGIINTSTNMIIGHIALRGHPEAFSIEENGTSIFANVPTANSIEEFSKANYSLLASWPLSNATENFPMALDERDNLLFVGFGLPPVIGVYSDKTGALVSMFNISSAGDDMFFDPSTNILMITCSAGFLDVFRQVNSSSYDLVSAIRTVPLARTSLFYPEQHELLLAVPQHDGLSAQLLTYSITPNPVS